jgi:hypothetical protein
MVNMVEPTTFEEFEDYVQKKSYLYPITSELLSWGKADNTEEFWYHRDGIKRLWDRYGKAPSIECIIGFGYYFVETMNAIEYVSKHSNFDLIAINLRTADVNGSTFNFPKYDRKQFPNLLDGGDIDYVMAEDVTDYLTKSIDPKKGSKRLSSAIQEGKRIYALVGPPIHKWKKDENRNILRDGHKDFMMDLSNELIFYSILCAQYTRPFYRGDEFESERFDSSEWNRAFDENLKFIADTEVYDVLFYYKRKEKKRYDNMIDGKESTCYGIYVDELNKIREHFKIGPPDVQLNLDGEEISGLAIYLLCDYPSDDDPVDEEDGAKYKRLTTFFQLFDARNFLFENFTGPEMLFFNGIYMDIISSFEEAVHSRPELLKNSQMQPGFDFFEGGANEMPPGFEYLKATTGNINFLLEDVLQFFNHNTHDKIPHSYVGSLVKHMEITYLIELLEKDLTNEGIRGFEIKHPLVKSKFISNNTYKNKINRKLSVLKEVKAQRKRELEVMAANEDTRKCKATSKSFEEKEDEEDG